MLFDAEDLPWQEGHLFLEEAKRELPLGLQSGKRAIRIAGSRLCKGKAMIIANLLQAIGWHRGARGSRQVTTLRRSDRHVERPRPHGGLGRAACGREIERVDNGQKDEEPHGGSISRMTRRG